MIPIVEAEEDVYRFVSSDNGSAPMWCHGSTCLVRIGDHVFASGLETIEGLKTLNNCRWILFERSSSGWRRIHVDDTHRTREPCPLACFQDGRFFLSANPTLAPDTAGYGVPARPEILEFNAAEPRAPFKIIHPGWDGDPAFTEHSYRSFAADGARCEMILFQNVGNSHVEWAFRDATETWVKSGKLEWPWGGEYDTPQSIRVCYPNVSLKNGAVHFCGVSDILEPYSKWRKYKRKITGKDWDYDFRRLFYTWTPDIRSGKFRDWVEISSRDDTCGWISPGDLWVAPDGAVHLVWRERAIDERLRDRFFPDARQSNGLYYAVVRDGEVVERRSLVLAEEGKSEEIQSLPRFHVAPDNRLLVVFYCGGKDAVGRPVSENRVLRICDSGAVDSPVRVPLQEPMTCFFTTTERGGSARSDVLDLLGTPVESGRIRYARIRFSL